MADVSKVCDPIDRDRVYSVEKWDDEDEDGDVLEHQEEEAEDVPAQGPRLVTTQQRGLCDEMGETDADDEQW